MGTPPKPNPTPLPPAPAGGAQPAAPAPPAGATAAGAAAASGPPATINLKKAGDTATSSGPLVSVPWDPSFAKFHSITFSLTVTDSLNVTSTNVARCTVNIQQNPVAAVTGPAAVSATNPIPLDASTSTGVGLKYNWTLVSAT